MEPETQLANGKKISEKDLNTYTNITDINLAAATLQSPETQQKKVKE